MYSEALEQQVSLLHYLKSSPGRKFLDYCNDVAGMAKVDQRWASSAGWTEKHTRMYLIEPLTHGEPFFWSQDTCTLLERSARSVPDCVLTPAMLPVKAGYAWFSKPISAPCLQPNVLTAVLWHVLRDNQGRRVCVVVPLLSHGVRPSGLPIGAFNCEEGLLLLDDTADDHLGEGRREMRQYFIRVFAAMLLFLDQRILVSSPQQAERHTRRRLEREGWESVPLIRVVELRKRERIGDKHPVQPVERDWSCQWIVRGHWRQQFYPSKHTTRPIWITPYVKGPDDKPLKPPRATVFAVIR